MKYQTLASWIQKRRRERGEYPEPGEAAAPTLSARFAEVDLGGEDAGVAPPPLILKLPGGAEVTLNSISQAPVAAALLQALTSAGPC